MVGHRHVVLCHERAYEDGGRAVELLRRAFAAGTGGELKCVAVPEDVLPLGDAVRSYLFNSQLVTVADGTMALVAPAECREMGTAAAAMDFIRARVAEITAVHYVDVRQSMRNGGGPACLRLRVELTAEERAAVHGRVMLDGELYRRLRGWVERHYREELRLEDLADGKLLEECRGALDELTGILGLGSFYGFQLSGK
jgi:succinylarginine dihydrolase